LNPKANSILGPHLSLEHRKADDPERKVQALDQGISKKSIDGSPTTKYEVIHSLRDAIKLETPGDFSCRIRGIFQL
jgi:hypothetical protein